MKFPTGFTLHIEIYTASHGFPATARLLFLLVCFLASFCLLVGLGLLKTVLAHLHEINFFLQIVGLE